MREQIAKWLPKTIVNSRINGYGDYDTPEQGVPIIPPKGRWWELCMTMNDSWGYQGNDKNYKSPNQIIRIFVDCISMGGNLLLDIGPKEDGTIPPEQENILRELGKVDEKASRGDLWHGRGHSQGVLLRTFSLVEGSLDALSCTSRVNRRAAVLIKGLKNKINRAWVVGNGTKLETKIMMKQYWSAIPGLVYIDVPSQVLDKQVTVIAVLLDGPIDLFHENTK